MVKKYLIIYYINNLNRYNIKTKAISVRLGSTIIA